MCKVYASRVIESRWTRPAARGRRVRQGAPLGRVGSRRVAGRAAVSGDAGRHAWHPRERVAPRFSDPRLRALSSARCPECEFEAGVGSGSARFDRTCSRWLVEYGCAICGARFEAWREAVDAEVRAIAREHSGAGRPGAVVVSGEIGGGGPTLRRADQAVDAADAGAIVRVEDGASDFAAAMRRGFVLTVGVEGEAVHAERPKAGVVGSSLVQKTARSSGLAGALGGMIARAELELLPPTVGKGPGSLRVEWRGPGGVVMRTFRLRRSGRSRDFGGERVTRGAVELVDGLVDLIHWVDGGGEDPPWPLRRPPHFPDAEDLVHRRRAARLAVTHDWDGARANHRIREVVVSEGGALWQRTLEVRRAGLGLASEARVAVEAREAQAVVEALGRLDPPRMRRRLGFVGTSCGLDRTHTHTLEWFDGRSVSTTTLVFGSERGIGVVMGDAPPNGAEARAFEVLSGLLGG